MYASEYKKMLIRTPIPSVAAPAEATAAAPWRRLFLEHLGQMSAPLCAVSTLHPAESGPPASSSSNSGFSAMTAPRVRNCVCRGLWASLPDNARNPAPRNPEGVYESDLPVFTTDVRMAKAWELSASAPESAAGLHGGGPIEAVWWVGATGTQWRVRGRAWLLGPDMEGAGGAKARAAISRRMRRTADADGQDWSWAREITAHFGNLSPGMRGSFRNPAPGTARLNDGSSSSSGSGSGSGLGKPVGDDDLDNAAARANFRVCVIVPEEVDQTDLSRGDDPRRWLYTYVGAGGQAVHEGGVVEGEWEKLEVWP